MRRTSITTAALSSLLLAGCGYEGAQDLPLPGAVGGPDTYRLTMILDDATNLVVKETCRTNDTIVGSVESITLDKNLKARVVCRIKNSAEIPANATATLRETSLLGERFVSLDPPKGQDASGRLTRGSTLPASTTRVDPNAEMVLGALSQVLNGGSLGSVETISRELETALSGSDLGGTVNAIDTTVGELNDHRTDITASLESLDRLTSELEQQRDVIAEALDTIPGGLEVLDRQRPRLVAALRELSELSRVVVPLIRDTKADTVADLKHLQPVLSQLTKAGDEVALTLERLITFPFPSNAYHAIRGDYGGFYGTVELDIDSLNEVLGAAPTTEPQSAPESAGEPPTGGPLFPGLLDLLDDGSNPESVPAEPRRGGLFGGLLGGGS